MSYLRQMDWFEELGQQWGPGETREIPYNNTCPFDIDNLGIKAYFVPTEDAKSTPEPTPQPTPAPVTCLSLRLVPFMEIGRAHV